MAPRRKTKAVSAVRVVGIGASAGGITALQSLFQALPPELDLAFVVVQHLTPASRAGSRTSSANGRRDLPAK